MFRDKLDIDLAVGDRLAVAMANGSSGEMRVGKITELIEPRTTQYSGKTAPKLRIEWETGGSAWAVKKSMINGYAGWMEDPYDPDKRIPTGIFGFGQAIKIG